jgi:SpoVK/Ycf46/Vps4 family AAA+-type ATPase
MNGAFKSSVFGRHIAQLPTHAPPESAPTNMEPSETRKVQVSEKVSEATAATSDVRFEAREPAYSLEDMVLPDATRAIVNSMLAKLERRHLLYETWNLKKLEPSGGRLVFNLYGPPGTGKTMLAEAMARRLGMKIVEVSYAEIESKYVGDTSKNIVAAFKEASIQGAAIFFDEADSILGKRMTQVTQSADHAVNVSRAVMLKELDRFGGVVMFATNLARNFDAAFVRRILFHVNVPPPDLAGRRALWHKMIPEEVPGKDALNLDALALESDGLVGGEIRNAIMVAASEAVQREGYSQRLTKDDLSMAIELTRRAKREVGPSQRTVTDVELDAADVPSDLGHL